MYMIRRRICSNNTGAYYNDLRRTLQQNVYTMPFPEATLLDRWFLMLDQRRKSNIKTTLSQHACLACTDTL